MKMEWISVKDRLPEDNSLVLGLGYNPQFLIKKTIVAQVRINYLRGNWTESYCPSPFELTHWMPLPEPPKE